MTPTLPCKLRKTACQLLLFGLAAFAATWIGFAAAPAWPADFWTQVSNHVNAVAPSGVQVDTASESIALSFANSAASDSYGTSEEPFSTEFPSREDSIWTLIETHSVGMVILIF